MVKVPGVERVAAAEQIVLAASAFARIASERFEPVFPYVFEVVAANIALNKLGSAFYVKARSDVAVVHNARGVNPCIAEKIPLANFAFKLLAEIMAAPVGHFHTSLDGLRETNDWFRQKQGGFDLAKAEG